MSRYKREIRWSEIRPCFRAEAVKTFNHGASPSMEVKFTFPNHTVVVLNRSQDIESFLAMMDGLKEWWEERD